MNIEDVRELERQSARAELLIATAAVLERISVKNDLTPIGVALDVGFLETVALYASAVHEYLEAETGMLGTHAPRDTERPVDNPPTDPPPRGDMRSVGPLSDEERAWLYPPHLRTCVCAVCAEARK
jgi:hypothetical protein